MPESHQCTSHAMFEKMIQQSLDALTDRVAEGVRVFSAQSVQNGEMLTKVLENQAVRKELCGRQSERIDGHEERIETMEQEIKTQQKYLWIGVGVLGTAQVIAVPLFVWLITKGVSI